MDRFILLTLCIIILLITISAAGVGTISYFGGSGDDEVAGAAYTSDGSIIIGGASGSAELAGQQGTRLADGDGFVAKLDESGTALQWLVRLPSVRKLYAGPGDAVYVLLERSVAVIAADGSAWLREGGDLGASTVDVDIGPHGSIAVLAGGNAHVFNPDGMEQWNVEVGRSHPLCIAMDPVTGDVWVGGDQNTNTGFEPWRSPFLFRYAAASGNRTAELWNWPGPAVRADGKQLQADSFISFLKFSADGRLWIGAGSDGGNTVLTKIQDDLDREQDALSGSCYSDPCFGYKGAKKTGMFARMTQPVTDMERGSWVVPYVGMDPGSHLDPPCGCKGSNFQGEGVNPNSFSVTGILPAGNGVIILGDPWGMAPATPDGWFYNTGYPGGGIGWMGVFNENFTEITQATMLPGTKSAIGAYKDGRLLIAGRAPDLSSMQPDPAEPGWHIELPVTGNALQKDYAGGASDGYLMLACMDPSGECPLTSIPPKQFPGDGTFSQCRLFETHIIIPMHGKDISGRAVLLTPDGRLVDFFLIGGGETRYELTRPVSSGIYLLRLEFDGEHHTLKLVR